LLSTVTAKLDCHVTGLPRPLCRHCLGVLLAPNGDGPVKFANAADR
jgi:hypothetical protein